MRVVRGVLANFGTTTEFLGLLWSRKLWWLVPMAGLLLLLGLLLVFAAASGLSPFIYTLF